MEEARPRRRFSITVQIYLWLFFALFGFGPLFATNAVAERLVLPMVFWAMAFGWPVAIAVLFFYAQRRCTSADMTLRDGLLHVTSSMMTGWTTLSFATIVPALTVTYVGAVLIAFGGDIRRDPKYAAEKWLLIVRFFYRHRMRH